jgi:hypothetical protein
MTHLLLTYIGQVLDLFHQPFCENFQDWILQGCFERDAELRSEDQKVEELRQDAHRMCQHDD